jgi:predicted alpha/beta superfamily hydrolase
MPKQRCVLLFSLILLSIASLGQVKVHIVVSRWPAYHKSGDSVFLTGSFNNWNPADQRMLFKTFNGKPGITIEVPPGMVQFKLTRGSWARSEAGKNGAPVANHIIQVHSDTTIEVEVPEWTDHFPQAPRRSTASSQVQVIDTAFYIPQLKRHRRVWIYLPKGYASTTKKYPVLYLQDGQNIFDETTSGFGEWGVDEALDTLHQKEHELIVVAIDHGGAKRINEYAPYDMEKYGKGEGQAYADFLAKTLKPFIDKHYRTQKGEKTTWVAGSSMGGLISFYTVLKYPKVFGGAGVFSPAFWINPQLKSIDPHLAKKVKGRIYFYAGQLESDHMVSDMLDVFNQMLHHSKARMETVIRAEGKHNEPTWRAEFPLFVQWMMEGKRD